VSTQNNKTRNRRSVQLDIESSYEKLGKYLAENEELLYLDIEEHVIEDLLAENKKLKATISDNKLASTMYYSLVNKRLINKIKELEADLKIEIKLNTELKAKLHAI